ncbi:MAG: putative F0F1-ATPase subunit Ca2+/Mg2+ transporter [Candidatus Parcubacteria bacterium]
MKRNIRIVDSRGNVAFKEIDIKEAKKNWYIDPTYLNLGFYLAAPLVGGVFLGSYLDTKFRTKPVLTLLLIVVGLISTFYNLYKILKNAQRITGDKH